MKKILPILTLGLVLACSCRRAPERDQHPRMTPGEEKEMLLRVNKFLVTKDIELIKSYAARRGWDMEVSETGLFYDIYRHTQGRKVKNGTLVRIGYRVSLLDGTLCYSSEKDGEKQCVLGKSQEIAGLEQGLEMMREGEKARFIIPPHLAYGLLGDEKKIPARSILVYEVDLLKTGDPV